ncbi:MAG: Rrf2 family transcriptional regulator [Megasphaera sp.]|jgi:Rrf2 family protein|nr:Rrf2 family transcriptional regulator [Megasphaera sp.]MCI1247489.1 Rrf2 family transcriptional regulator [Megasphaera sp.]
MQFNITTDYAIRTVLYLAITKRLATATEISKAMNIPQNYQLKVTSPLVKKGILKRIQGVKGGFCLGRDSKDITLYDIINTMETTTNINPCLDKRKGGGRFTDTPCPIRDFYERIQMDLEEQLQQMTVNKLSEKVEH